MVIEISLLLQSMAAFASANRRSPLIDEIDQLVGLESKYDTRFLIHRFLAWMVEPPLLRENSPSISSSLWYDTLSMMINNHRSLSLYFYASPEGLRIVNSPSNPSEEELRDYVSTIYKPFTSVLYKDL